MHNLAHNQVVHERVVFLTVVNEEIPRVAQEERVMVRALRDNCYQITVRYGFKDESNIPEALEACREHGLVFETLKTSFFISRDIVVATPGAGMAMWRERLFATMSRNASSAAEYFKLPANRVLELGTRVKI